MVKKIWLLLTCALCHTLAAVKIQPGFFEQSHFTVTGPVIELTTHQETMLALFVGQNRTGFADGDILRVNVEPQSLELLLNVIGQDHFDAAHAETILKSTAASAFLPLLALSDFFMISNAELHKLLADHYLSIQDQISFDELNIHARYITAFFQNAPTTQQQLHEAFEPHLCMRTLFCPKCGVHSVAFSPDGTLLATGSVYGPTRIWDINAGKCLHALEPSFTHSVAFSPDGTSLAIGGNHGTTLIWNIHTNQRLRLKKSPSTRLPVWSVAFSRYDGMMLVSCPDITIFNLFNNQIIKKLNASTFSATFSPDGTKLAIGSSPVEIWDTHTWQRLHTFTAHAETIWSVAFSPDGTLFATGSSDNTARIWDTHTWQCLHTLTGHTGVVNSVAFSPDNTKLATASLDFTTRLWDIRTGECLCTLHDSGCRSVAFSPDGTLIATGGGGSNARLWFVKKLTDPQQLVMLWIAHHPRGFRRGASAYLDEIFNSLPDIVKHKIESSARHCTLL